MWSAAVAHLLQRSRKCEIGGGFLWSLVELSGYLSSVTVLSS